MSKILVTGSCGLIGRALRARLHALDIATAGIDLLGAGPERGDIRDHAALERVLDGCSGIVHLAAVSRVVWAQRDPDLCWSTNVGGLQTLLAASAAAAPWIVFASSREVYGQAAALPVTEDSPLQPVNVYARSKVEGERLLAEAIAAGRRGAIVRFSNVYGKVEDHADRVVPAFARAAATGQPIRVDGSGNTFDFTFIDDVVDGVVALVHKLRDGRAAMPPVHFVSGEPTTLGQLAALAQMIARNECRVEEAPPRDFDVAHFTGDPSRAHALLGWRATVGLRDGLARLIGAFRALDPVAATGADSAAVPATELTVS